MAPTAAGAGAAYGMGTALGIGVIAGSVSTLVGGREVMKMEASTTPFGADVTVDSIDPRTGGITWDSGAVSYPVGQAQTVSRPLDGVIGAASSSARGMQVAGSIALGAVDTISGAVQSAGYRYGIVGTAESRADWAMNVAPAMVESVKNFVADPIPPVQQWWGNLTSG